MGLFYKKAQPTLNIYIQECYELKKIFVLNVIILFILDFYLIILSFKVKYVLFESNLKATIIFGSN